MLKKKASAEPASPMRRGGDPQPPSPPASKLARRGNGGSPPSLLLPTRSLPSLFSTDAPTSMGEQPKKPPCFGASPRNGGGSVSFSSHCGGIGGQAAAGLAGVLVSGEADGGGYLKKGRVLLGMRLRVQLPPPPGKADLVPGPPIEFGVKNRDVQLALLSPVQRSPLSSAARAARWGDVEEELAEDYTCVIARGPNPRMTHIFEDRVVQSPAGAGAGDGDACCLLTSPCCGCEEEDALLLQRGEKAFCSTQCSNNQEAILHDSSDTFVELKEAPSPSA